MGDYDMKTIRQPLRSTLKDPLGSMKISGGKHRYNYFETLKNK